MSRILSLEERALERNIVIRRIVARSMTRVETVERMRAAEAVRTAVERANAMLPPDLAEMMRGRG